MKQVGIILGAFLAFVGLTPQASAGLFLYPGQLNEVIYNNYENLYDVQGNLLPAGTIPFEGDYLAGIFQVNRINDLTGGGGTNIPDNLMFTGVFAQQVSSVTNPSAGVYDLTFSNPTLNTFNASGDSFTLSALGPTTMFALYADPVLGGTQLTFQGPSLASNVATAQDGTLLLTAGLDPLNLSNVALGSAFFVVPPFPFGVATASLSIVDNNTGFTFSPVTFSGLTGQLVIRSRFDPNTDPLSKWEFTSFDPAEVQPNIPEVSSLWMLGMGLSGFGIFSRRKLFS